MVAEPRAVAPEQPQYEIDARLQKELLAYPGKWAAINGSELLAVSDSPVEAYEQARAKGEEMPILYRVPEPGARVYYY